MSKLNQIQQALIKVSGGKFQKICDRYIYESGYGKVSSWGSVDGKDKSKTGTPDSYILLDNGKYIFIEHTSQQSGVYRKFNSDLDDDFNPPKIGIPISKIDKIIICYNSKLSPQSILKLSNKCKKNNCEFEFFDLSILSFGLLQTFPHIAKDELSIEIDTGQILPPNVFIEHKTKFSTPLNNEFLFRKKELNEILTQLNSNDLMLITGKPGIGKTKIALEAMNQFKESNNEYKLYCIENKNLMIYDDLKAYFSKNIKALILVDDANRISQIQNIIDLINYNSKEKHLKLILTVRDYAYNELKNILNHISYGYKRLESLNRSEIQKILQSDDIGIKNLSYLERICNISKGNPRLALMAAKVALEKNDLYYLSDATKIYDNFFHKVFEEVKIGDDKTLLKVLGIVSYFRIIDVRNKVCNSIYKVFDITQEEFWDKIIILNDLEIIDLYEKQICKIIDQIQANFFFYRIIIKDKIIPFKLFLENFFFEFESKMRDIIIPIVNTFNYDVINSNIESSIESFWNEIQKNEEKFLNFVDVFWFVKRNETLAYIYKKVKNILPKKSSFDFSEKVTDINDKYLSILKYYVYSLDEFQISLEIIFLYAEKMPSIIPEIIYYISTYLGYKLTSYQYGYYLQIELFKFLIEKSKKNSQYTDLIFHISPSFLKVEHENAYTEGMTFTTTRFKLVFTSKLKALRHIIINFLLNRGSIDQIMNFIKEYTEMIRNIIPENILSFASLLYPKKPNDQ